MDDTEFASYERARIAIAALIAAEDVAMERRAAALLRYQRRISATFFATDAKAVASFRAKTAAAISAFEAANAEAQAALNRAISEAVARETNKSVDNRR